MVILTGPQSRSKKKIELIRQSSASRVKDLSSSVLLGEKHKHIEL